MNDFHTSVLLHSVIDNLNVSPGKRYIDATLGGGGHASAIIDRGGVVLGLDQDEEAIAFVKQKFLIPNSPPSPTLRRAGKFLISKGSFKDIREIARKKKFENVDGILFDLGVSSHQFDTPERGFSFQYDAPLDMRMDRDLQVTAEDLVNGLHKSELAALFMKLGQEYQARRIAEAIVGARSRSKIRSTKELAQIILKAGGGKPKPGDIHPATKVFQSLRIAVNDELNSIREGLAGAIELLGPSGRLVVISFHSLEDRIVKHAFLEFEEKHKGKIVTKKPIIPDEKEQRENRRSRSAKMRVFERG